LGFSILEPSLNEINGVTDIYVSYEILKSGRKITGIRFDFKHKELGERLKSEVLARQILSSPKKTHKEPQKKPNGQVITNASESQDEDTFDEQLPLDLDGEYNLFPD